MSSKDRWKIWMIIIIPMSAAYGPCARNWQNASTAPLAIVDKGAARRGEIAGNDRDRGCARKDLPDHRTILRYAGHAVQSRPTVLLENECPKKYNAYSSHGRNVRPAVELSDKFRHEKSLGHHWTPSADDCDSKSTEVPHRATARSSQQAISEYLDYGRPVSSYSSRHARAPIYERHAIRGFDQYHRRYAQLFNFALNSICPLPRRWHRACGTATLVNVPHIVASKFPKGVTRRQQTRPPCYPPRPEYHIKPSGVTIPLARSPA